MFSMRREKTGKKDIIAAVLLLLLSAFLLCAARIMPGFAQWYSVTVYPLIVSFTGRIFGILPFSASEMLCTLLPIILAADVISIIKRRKSAEKRSAAVFVRHLMLLAAILLFLYSANCGVNYYRDPFISDGSFDSTDISSEDLAEFCDYTAEKLNDCYNQQSKAAAEYPEGSELRRKAVSAMESLSSQYPELSGYYPEPKLLTFMSPLFSMMGVSGIYSPFTVEANVNGQMPGLEMPFTSCHELSHLRGFMDEGEANYIGWLACIDSDDPAFRRSGWLIAWSYAGGALKETNPEAFTSIYEKLPDGAIRELTSNYLFWHEHENRASDIQDKVNDTYLRSNGQENGVLTYGQVTDLMIRWYRDQM